MAATLSDLRDRVEQVLEDAGNTHWTTGALDEAIRLTLDELSLIQPQRAVGTVTLAAAGREISLAALPPLLHVERVWWEYLAAAPDYPPAWRKFELWPGKNLWIDDGLEPQAGDVVRVFYTARHTLNGLDAATVTTLPDDQASLIVVGATGHAARSRALSVADRVNVDGWTSQRMNEWGEAQLKDFRNGLARLSRQAAARASGIAGAPLLDRWEDGGW